jgi:hypothetical protein
VRFVDAARPEKAGNQQLARHFRGGFFGQGHQQLEQQRAGHQRRHTRALTRFPPTSVDQELRGGEQLLELRQAHAFELPRAQQASHRRLQTTTRRPDLGQQRDDSRSPRRRFRVVERPLGIGMANALHRHVDGEQLGHRHQACRRLRQPELRQRLLDGVDLTEQQQPARLNQTRKQRVGHVPAAREQAGGGVEAAGGTAQVTQHQRDLGAGHDATGARHRFGLSERLGSSAQQVQRLGQFSQLGHRDAAQRQRGRVGAQRHVLQRQQRISDGQRSRRGADRRIHHGLLAPNRGIAPTLLLTFSPPGAYLRKRRRRSSTQRAP